MAFIQKEKLLGSTDDGKFGYSISSDEGYLAVSQVPGSPTNSLIYMYKKGSENNWVEQSAVLAATTFGYSMDISDHQIIVGSDSSFAVLFYIEDIDDNSWSYVYPITEPVLDASVLFGYSSAIDGEYGVIGSPGKDSLKGLAYVIKKVSGVYQILTIAGINGVITPNISQEANDFFGGSVAVDGDYIIVGAKGEDNSRGAVYVFNKDTGGDDSWGFVSRLTASDGKEGDNFGNSISISGDYIIIGAENKTSDLEELFAGASYVFKFSDGIWQEEEKIISSFESAGLESNNFGHSVSINRDYIAVGSPGARSDMGIVDIFNRNRGWSLVSKMTKEDSSAGDGGSFGDTVSVFGDFVFASSPTGNDNPSVNDSGSVSIFENPPVKVKLAQEFEVEENYNPSKASVYLKRMGNNFSNYWIFSDNQKNVIDASNFSFIAQSDNKIIYDDRTAGYTGDGYITLSVDNGIDIIGGDEDSFSIVTYPFRSTDDGTINIWLRCFGGQLDNVSSSTSVFEIDILLDGIVVKRVSEYIPYNSWSWVNTSFIISDNQEHDMGIRIKRKGNCIDKIYLDFEDIESPSFDGPSYSNSPYLTIHMRVYTSELNYPTTQLFVYDYKNSLTEIIRDDWYNFNISVLDNKGLSYDPSVTGENYFLIMSTSGGNENNFIIWEMLENDEYSSLASAIKV